jgi:hypothetical protein
MGVSLVVVPQSVTNKARNRKLEIHMDGNRVYQDLTVPACCSGIGMYYKNGEAVFETDSRNGVLQSKGVMR